MKNIAIILISVLSISCKFQDKQLDNNKVYGLNEQKEASQIAEYVTCVFEDSNANLWFGTLSRGIAKYDGRELRYYTKNDGLPSDRVTSVIEDQDGILWFNTGNGLSKFDGHKFKNYLVKDSDFGSNVISSLLIDSNGIFWVGTWNGVYQFDTEEFLPILIPYPDVDTKINEDTKNWIIGINEDHKGNIWFRRDGYGLCKYDGNSFSYVLKKDGLHSNNVTEIEFDKDGSIWIGTRVAERDNPDPNKRAGKGGLNRLMGGEIKSFPDIDGFNNDDVYEIFTDTYDHIWITTTRNGVYRYDRKEFRKYYFPISIMSIMNDKKGNLWFGGAGGLYRIDKNQQIINVKTNGPWE